MSLIGPVHNGYFFNFRHCNYHRSSTLNVTGLHMPRVPTAYISRIESKPLHMFHHIPNNNMWQCHLHIAAQWVYWLSSHELLIFQANLFDFLLLVMGAFLILTTPDPAASKRNCFLSERRYEWNVLSLLTKYEKPD